MTGSGGPFRATWDLPGDGRPRDPLPARRALVGAGVALAVAAAAGALLFVLGVDGLSGFDVALLACFLVSLPWNVVNFVNAAIGLALGALARDPLGVVLPEARAFDPTAPLRGRTAIVMPVHNEEPERVFRHLRATVRSLDATAGPDAPFEVFLLSDTRDPALAAEERARFEGWRAEDPEPRRLHYRRRADNAGAKTGNLWEWLERCGDRFDYFLVLDADSLMAGPAVLRMVRLMDANPRLGILQTLVTGLPSRSPFARVFQFGMRHGLRAYSLGGAWWQGDGGPYWGHNAILRTAAFRAHCRLPELPGRPPFGGRVLSHDQLEAALMRRAGYEVRVIPEEAGSYEENPPTLPDFLKRDLRWCQGNMQYAKVLGWPGLPPLARLQLVLAILMYAQAPAWVLFMGLGLAQGVAVAAGWLEPTAPAPAVAALATKVGAGLFLVTVGIVLAPWLAGVAQTLIRADARRAYGGGRRVTGSAAVALLFSLLLAPVMAVTQAKFILGMFFGRTVIWTAQARSARHVPLPEAWRNLRAPVAVGAGFVALALLAAPGALPWLLPVVTGLALAPLFAWATSLPGLGRYLAERRVCAVPEELRPPEEVRAAGFGDVRQPLLAMPPGPPASPGAAPAAAAPGGGGAAPHAGAARAAVAAAAPEP